MTDFDFLIGRWQVANRRRRGLLVGSQEWDEFPSTCDCVRLFEGAANVDWNDFPTLGFRGLSLRLFSPENRAWSIYWASSRDGVLQPAVVGAFSDGEGRFFGDDVLDGVPIRVRFVWSDITASSARWQQAFSTDGEQTWETNWTMEFTRA